MTLYARLQTVRAASQQQWSPPRSQCRYKICSISMTQSSQISTSATITILAHTTETAVASCSAALSSSIPPAPSSSVSSLPGFAWPTPSPTPAELLGKLEARQAEILSYSTSVVVGTIPIYAVVGCQNSGSIYGNVCACKSISSSTINSNGPRLVNSPHLPSFVGADIPQTTTSTATTTSTSIITSTASCSSSIVITLSHSSSTTVTTVTFTSLAGTGTATGTGTGTLPPSLASSSSMARFNTTTTPSSTLSSTTTTLNVTLTSSITPTPTCATKGYILCNGTCLNATSDEQNCGSCGNRCGDGLVCFNGVCARRPLDPPCDTNCTYRRECNTMRGASCSCARDSNGYGICFDANRYQCLSTTPKCQTTTDCELGGFCIKSICSEGPPMCSNTTDAEADGICVTSTGCGAQGPVNFGALLRFGEPHQRKRIVEDFNW